MSSCSKTILSGFELRTPRSDSVYTQPLFLDPPSFVFSAAPDRTFDLLQNGRTVKPRNFAASFHEHLSVPCLPFFWLFPAHRWFSLHTTAAYSVSAGKAIILRAIRTRSQIRRERASLHLANTRPEPAAGLVVGKESGPTPIREEIRVEPCHARSRVAMAAAGTDVEHPAIAVTPKPRADGHGSSLTDRVMAHRCAARCRIAKDKAAAQGASGRRRPNAVRAGSALRTGHRAFIAIRAT